MTKWTNRDAFVHSLKTKTGTASKKKYIYIYLSKILLFLLAAQESSDTQSSSMLVEGQLNNDFAEEDVAASSDVNHENDITDLPETSTSTRKRHYISSNNLNCLEKEILRDQS